MPSGEGSLQNVEVDAEQRGDERAEVEHDDAEHGADHHAGNRLVTRTIRVA